MTRDGGADATAVDWRPSGPHAAASLGALAAPVGRALANLAAQRVIERLWAMDHTVWKPDSTEIADRLGWLRSPDGMPGALPAIASLVDAVRADGLTHALLLGMGGSSLAPEVFRAVFGVAPGYLDLAVLDSTDPGFVLACAERFTPGRTLFVVSTKSGGTVETFSLFKFFFNRTAAALGAARAGQHFVAITDPGSGLEEAARRHEFRATFLNDPHIGGRYSALSHFGLVPAMLVGADAGELLVRAAAMAAACRRPDGENPGAWLGSAIGEAALAGRDKLTLIASPRIVAFGAWVEQLIAESTGKDGTGILPVCGEVLAAPSAYADDRLFVYLRLDGDSTHDAAAGALAAAGHPVVRINLRDPHDLGAEVFRWEVATAVAGWRLGINPFDQPNVESAKVLARQMVTAYQREGELPEPAPALRRDGIAVIGDVEAAEPGEALRWFLEGADPGGPDGRGRGYVALQAYLHPAPPVDDALQTLRTRIQARGGLAVTVGYGPRFLHSTGQLHKGDAGRGVFIQITADDPRDAPIPDEAGEDASSITFGVLKRAQALGDRQALLDAGRRVIRFHISGDVAAGLRRLAAAIA